MFDGAGNNCGEMDKEGGDVTLVMLMTMMIPVMALVPNCLSIHCPVQLATVVEAMPVLKIWVVTITATSTN